MKKQLDSRKNINQLIHLFYAKIRKDELLGDIFNQAIDDWDSHLEHLTDFWETNLLFVAKFKGDPIKTHQEVDQGSNSIIEQKHFDRWLKLWFETIDAHFEGKNADAAKRRAEKMAYFILIKIIEGRK